MKTITKIICTIALLAFFFAKSQQIDWNQINSNTIIEMISMQNLESHISSSAVLQMGDNNKAELLVNSKTNIIVQQLGDQNSIYFNNAFTDRETKTGITTQGYNNIVDVTGSNSISQGLQLNVKGENMTVFMRNY